jgi:hypothetical protein
MREELSEFFWIIHSGLTREGPGDNKSTQRAYRMLKDLPKNPCILDIGCGLGMQTVDLAKLCARALLYANRNENAFP